jgi:hypothetical protein
MKWKGAQNELNWDRLVINEHVRSIPSYIMDVLCLTMVSVAPCGSFFPLTVENWVRNPSQV